MQHPVWVELKAIVNLHREQIEESGGSAGVRDQRLLESALAAPQHLYYYSDPKPALTTVAACYAFSITRNHPFFDGNKRASLVACRLFLQLNGLNLVASQDEKSETFWLLADKQISQEQLAVWIAQRCVPYTADLHMQPSPVGSGGR